VNVRDLAEGAVRHGALQKPAEFASFLACLDPCPRIVVEIGCDAGGTLWAWTRIAQRVIGVDLPQSSFSSGRTLDSHGATMILGNSHDVQTWDRLVTELNGEWIDLLFIDGDHTYEGARLDWEMYSPLVAPGGIVAFHDVCKHHESLNVGVPQVWEEVNRANGKTGEEIVIGDATWGGIGWLRMERKPTADYEWTNA
jgi:predicted O-methyltransferase YrrM